MLLGDGLALLEVRMRNPVPEPPEEIRGNYRELKSLEGLLVGWQCIECQRVYPAPHLKTCSQIGPQPGARPPDEIEINPGMVSLPEEFRQVARSANAAGLAGFEIENVDYGIDTVAARKELENLIGEGFNVRCRARLTYRRPQ
jgi:hypothetical protein